MATIPAQTFDGKTINDTPFYNAPVGVYERTTTHTVYSVSGSGVKTTIIKLSTGFLLDGVVAASETQNATYSVFSSTTQTCSRSYTYNNKTVYYNYSTNSIQPSNNVLLVDVASYSAGAMSSVPSAQIAWLMVYGGYEGFPITYSLENCSGSASNPAMAPVGLGFTCTFAPDTDGDYTYLFTGASAIVRATAAGGGGLVSYDWDSETGILYVGAVESEVLIIIKAFDTRDPYESGAGASGVGIGQGIFDFVMDAIQDISIPPSALDSGFITAYNPSVGQLQALGASMWSLWLTDASFFDNLQRLFTNPSQAIVGLAILPGIIEAGSSQEIAFGSIGSGVSAPKITNQFQKYSVGGVSIPEYSGSYMDYAPNTEISIFLPYCGTYNLDPDDVMGKSISCEYLVDVISGGCIASLYVGGNLMYQFGGSMAVSVPVSQIDYSTTINGAISAAGGILNNISAGIAGLGGFGALGAIGGVALGLAKSAPSVVGTVMGSKPQITHGGSIGSGAALAGCQVPYVIIKRPRLCVPAKQNSFTGYPAFITYKVSDILESGYTEFADIHLEGISATDDEKAELTSILDKGVIL